MAFHESPTTKKNETKITFLCDILSLRLCAYDVQYRDSLLSLAPAPCDLQSRAILPRSRSSITTSLNHDLQSHAWRTSSMLPPPHPSRTPAPWTSAGLPHQANAAATDVHAAAAATPITDPCATSEGRPRQADATTADAVSAMLLCSQGVKSHATALALPPLLHGRRELPLCQRSSLGSA